MKLDFSGFNTGTLFLVRTPETFPVGYADESFADMKMLHFDYASLLETWNCKDGALWKSNKFPRSSYWKNEERDPIEECFAAADQYDMAFLPEAGMIDDAFMYANKDGMLTTAQGEISRYGRIGLVPSCPLALEYTIEKYDDLIWKFGAHPSFRGICMPCENGFSFSYDRYTRESWRKLYGFELPMPDVISADKQLEKKVFAFMENCFLDMYSKLAKYLKQKYHLLLMHYPHDKISRDSFHQPIEVYPGGNITLMNRVEELDLLNLQLHPPLNPDPYFFKMETEFLMANSGGKPCMGDTHFYHEYAAGRLPDTTPKRFVDNILSSVTPNGISFFCYGFMREELPLWKKELNPGAPVFRVYAEGNTVKARREMVTKALDYVEILRPMMSDTAHYADCAIYYPENLNDDYMYGSYPLEHIFGLHEVFNAAAIPLKFIDHIPQDSTEQKVLVFDTVKKLPENGYEKLCQYLKNGGKLVVIGKCCEEIEKAAAIKVESAKGNFIRHDESRDYNHCYIRLPIDCNDRYTEKNGKPVLYYDDGTPAVTQSEKTLYFGAADEIGRFSYFRDFRLAEWWKKYFTAQQLNSGVEFHNVYVEDQDKHQFVSCDLYGNESKKLLLVRNFGVDLDTSRLSWEIPQNMKITAAWADGENFDFSNAKKLPHFEYFVAVLAEKNKV